MLVKIHEAYRKIISVCDSELLGKKFEQDKFQLEIKESFYGGKGSHELDEAETLKILENGKREDACFNFAGKNSIQIAIKAGIVDNDSIINIQGIPHALSLL